MRRIYRILVTLMAAVVAVSLIGNTSGFANGEQGYETVGGEVAPINFITTFLVPALIIITIFGALILLGVIRIRSDAKKST